YQKTARLGESESARRQAIAGWNALLDDFRGVSEYRGNLARNWQLLGSLLKELGRLTEGEKAFRTAVGIREKLAIDSLDDPQAQKAAEAYTIALAVIDKAVESTAEPRVRQQLAPIASSLGHLLLQKGRHAEAGKAFGTAAKIWQKLAIENPDDSSCVEQL